MRAYNLQNEQPPAFPDTFQIVKNVVLSRTSLEANNNKFYVLEVHEAQSQYRLFTNYGRVGTDGVKEGRFSSCREEVIAEFERIFKEKTSPRKGYVPVEVEKATVGSSGPSSGGRADAGKERRQVIPALRHRKLCRTHL